jgi:Holliday junction resolvasome RuvABC ATP-dependent DNA helicase subunit
MKGDNPIRATSNLREQDEVVKKLLYVDREALSVERDIIRFHGIGPILNALSLANKVTNFFLESDARQIEIYEALIQSGKISIEAPAFLVRQFAHGCAAHQSGAVCHEYGIDRSEIASNHQASAAIQDEIDRLENNAAHTLEIDGSKQSVFALLLEVSIGERKLWGIKSVLIRNTTLVDFSFLEGVPNIEKLTIENCKISVAPFCGNLHYLEEVKIKHCPLVDISGFASAQGLRILSIEDAPLADIAALRGSHLRGLRVDRTKVEDISVSPDIGNLEWLSIEDTDVVDLAPVLRCSELQAVMFQGSAAARSNPRLAELGEVEFEDEEADYFKKFVAILKDQVAGVRVEQDGRAGRPFSTVSGNAGIDELDSLIGLGSVKAEIKKLVVGAQYAIKRREKGLPVDQPTLHLVFTGNPGTGKTTVARLVGKIYRDLGLLAKGHVVEVARHDLVADYLGQTAGKTTKKLEEALDGVLFIDEAYTLAPDTAHQDYGREAIDAMLVFMENNRERISIIAAGYAGEMQRFIGSNPGLKSRFTRYIDFEDYAVGECMSIFRKMVGDSHYSLTAEAKASAEVTIAEMINQEQPHFANGRSVRNLFEKVRERQNMRVVLEEVNDITLIEAEDICL